MSWRKLEWRSLRLRLHYLDDRRLLQLLGIGSRADVGGRLDHHGRHESQRIHVGEHSWIRVNRPRE